MDEIILHTYGDRDLGNAVAIVGFPSIGLVSSIAANFIARELKLELIAGISSPGFPPYAIMQNGVPLPPIRIYAGDRKCRDDAGLDCDRLVVITSEFMPKMEQHHPIATTVLDWLSDNGIRTVITLDGIHPASQGDHTLLGAGSTPSVREIMKKYGINEFVDGMIRGTSGVMLFEGANRDLDVLTLLGSAKSDMPDPRGAAKLMEPLGKMLPELKIDTAPLYIEADELEKRMKNQNSPAPNLPRDQLLYG